MQYSFCFLFEKKIILIHYFFLQFNNNVCDSLFRLFCCWFIISSKVIFRFIWFLRTKINNANPVILFYSFVCFSTPTLHTLPVFTFSPGKKNKQKTKRKLISLVSFVFFLSSLSWVFCCRSVLLSSSLSAKTREINKIFFFLFILFLSIFRSIFVISLK